MFTLNKIVKIVWTFLFIFFITDNLIYADRHYWSFSEFRMANGCVRHTAVLTVMNGSVSQHWFSHVDCPPGTPYRINQSNYFSELLIESGKTVIKKGNFDDYDLTLFELMEIFDNKNIVGKKLTKSKMDDLIKERDKIIHEYYGDKLISFSSRPPRDCDECDINKEIESLKKELTKKAR